MLVKTMSDVGRFVIGCLGLILFCEAALAQQILSPAERAAEIRRLEWDRVNLLAKAADRAEAAAKAANSAARNATQAAEAARKAAQAARKTFRKNYESSLKGARVLSVGKPLPVAPNRRLRVGPGMPFRSVTGTPPDPTGVGGFAMPDLQNEKNTYTKWGWTWAQSIEPNFLGDPSYTVVDPDIHGGSEGDDLWTYLMMYLRTGKQGYLDRATAWKNYFLTARTSSGFKFDKNSFGSDHMYGWGLVAWYEYTGDQAALAEAENLAAVVEDLWTPVTSTNLCLPAGGCMQYGVRKIGRHLHLATRVAEITGKQRWIDLRGKILTTLMNSNWWNDQYGMYFNKDQVMSPFQIGVLVEAMAHVYRVTGHQDVKDRMIAMARFVAQYGLDPTYQYAGSRISIKSGAVSHNFANANPVTFWDPVYTTSFINTLVWGYKLTGDQQLLNSAKTFFNRGTKGIYGSPSQRKAGDNEVGHFIDTKFDTSWGKLFLAYNKGELQYTYMIFENDGSPTVLGSTPPLTTPPPPVTTTLPGR